MGFQLGKDPCAVDSHLEHTILPRDEVRFRTEGML